MRLQLYVIIILAAINCHAQDVSSESKIISLYNKALEVRQSDLSMARTLVQEAIGISLKNNRIRYGQLAYLKGDLFLDGSEYDSAYNYFEEALLFLDKDDPTFGRACFGKSSVEYYRGHYEKALAMAITAEQIARIKNDKQGLIRAVKIIGTLAETEDDYEKSIDYFQEALIISEEIRDTLNIVRSLNSLATPYCMNNDFEKGRELLLKAVALALKINCLKCQAISYSQLGINDFYWKKYERSISYYEMEQTINRQLGESFNLFFPYQNIAESLMELGKFDKALMYNDSALHIALTHKAKRSIHDAYKIRYALFKVMNNLPQALSAFENQMVYKDSIYSSEKAEITENLKVSYETERREQRIKELEQQKLIKELEAKTARQWQYGLIVFLVLLTVVVIILYNRYQLKQRTAKALDEKNMELQKLNGFKDRMFAVISHDLRNPVNAFSTIIESLHQNIQHASKEELSEFLESTLQSANDLKSLLNNLLEWALVQIEKLPFNATRVSIHDMIAESISHIELMAASKKIEIENAVEPDKSVMVDRGMMIIVIRNLVSNAVKFSPTGSRVELVSYQSNGTIKIEVRDQGMGMKEEDVLKLFKIEESTSSIGSSPEKGAGIGLLLCRELVEKNNGHISVKSKPDEGSIFTIELPSATL